MPDNQVHQNIRVAVRCRPLNKYEKDNNALSCVNCSNDKVTVRDRNSSKVFTFDQVFGPFSKQIDVYKSMVAPAVDEILLGYNCTIFAYGPTGSGKTFTMTGERSDKLRYAWEDDPMVGIIPRALSHLFDQLEKNKADFSVRVSFVEVYNEELFDLLSVADTGRLTIYDDVNRKGSVIIKGLREIVVLDKDNVHTVIERGLARRQTASTLLNAQSSRSHSIFTVTVHIKEVHPLSGEDLLRIGKLHLVDLAGSESIGRSGAVDKRAREAGSINQSLLTLGRVITALLDHTSHIPYRESKLTRLLQDSLGGKTKTSIIATISPSSLSLEETLSTLDYAHRAKNIKNRPELNVRLNKTDLVRSYNEELERLRRDLEAARTKTGIFVDVENYQALNDQIKQQRERIGELEERREAQENEMLQLQDMFTMTQSELTEARDLQEKIGDELKACQSDLEEKQLRLLKLKFRLEEEEHLRRQHEHTELTLRQQATELLTTAKTAIGDVTTLHQKVDRLTELERHNRDRLFNLVSTWTVERVGDPVEQVARLSERLSAFCQQIQNCLSDLRTHNEKLTADLFRQQASLKTALAQSLASECIRDADQTELFAQEQLNLSKQCLDETLRPQSVRVKATQELLAQTVTEMCDLINNHNNVVNKLNKRTEKVMQHISGLSAQSMQFLTEQQQSTSAVCQLWDEHCARRESLMETLRKTMSSLDSEHELISKSILSSLSSDTNRLTEWKTLYEKNMADFEAQSRSVHKSMLDQNTSFSSALNRNLSVSADAVETARRDHDVLQSKVDECLERLCQQASTFSTDGLGAELRQRAELWKDPSLLEHMDESSRAQHASMQLDALIRVTEDKLEAMSKANTEKALAVENLSGNISYEASAGFAGLKDDLQAIPGDLESELSSNLQPYSPTGQTPQPKSFRYPENLAQTASHSRLRRAFRAVQLEPGLEQLLTPLSQHDRSLDTIRESHVDTASEDRVPPLEEENPSTAVVGTPIRGKIVPLLSLNDTPAPSETLVIPDENAAPVDPAPTTPLIPTRRNKKKKN